MRLFSAFPCLSLVVLAACTPEADYPNDVIAESEHFVYRARAGAPFCLAALTAIENHFEAARVQLGFTWPPGRRITYYLYRDETDFAKNAPCEGAMGCTRVDGKPEVHARRPVDRHELVHAYLAHIGLPHPIYAEGIAGLLYCDSAVQPASSFSADWREQLFLTSNGEFVAYHQASTLVRYLLAKFGYTKFLEAYAQSRHQLNPDSFALEFSRLFRDSIDQVWLSALAAVPRDGVMSLCPCDAPPASTDGSELANQVCAEAPDEYRPTVFRLDEPSLVLVDTLNTTPENQIRACKSSAPVGGSPLPLSLNGARTLTVFSLAAGEYFWTGDLRPRIQARPFRAACKDVPPFPLGEDEYSSIVFSTAGEGSLMAPLRFRASYEVVSADDSLRICESCPESGNAACTKAATVIGKALSGDMVLMVAAGAGQAQMTLAIAP